MIQIRTMDADIAIDHTDLLCRTRNLEYERKRSALTQDLPYALLGLREVSIECESMVHASGELVLVTCV